MHELGVAVVVINKCLKESIEEVDVCVFGIGLSASSPKEVGQAGCPLASSLETSSGQAG